MIDEKRLIDRIRHDIECAEADMMKDHGLYVRVADMIHMIEGQPKINRWIPVEERLPEPLENVIVYHDMGKIDIGYWDYDGDYVYQSLGKALAWLPLPEPYSSKN